MVLEDLKDWYWCETVSGNIPYALNAQRRIIKTGREGNETYRSSYLSSQHVSFVETLIVTAQFSEAGVEQFKVAVNAPDFTRRKLGGGEISLKDLKGRVVLLNFFATY